MVTNEQDIKVERSGNIVEAKFDMNKEDLAHVFNIMRKQTYSDEILAVCREYMVNGRDAGVESKTDRRMEVTLPVLDNMNWVCRDFGPGMDFDTIVRIYTKYGKSTKRGTNAQTGMLGIGSKSGFAYGDEFSIISYKDGVKYTCSAYIDETEIGMVALLGTNETDEPNGMEIVVPVRQQDMNAFCRKTAEVARYLDVKPILKGRVDENWMEEYGADREAFIDGTDWRYIGDSNRSVAIMGGIAYRINQHSLENLPQDIARLIGAGVEMTFETGSLSFASSREDLKYDETTQALIMGRLKMIHNAILDLIEDDFEACPSLWDAQILYHDLFSLNGELAAIRKVVKGNVFWTKQNNYWVSANKRFMVDDEEYKFGGWDRYENGYCRLHKYTFDADGLPKKKERAKSLHAKKGAVFLILNGGSKAGEREMVYALGQKGYSVVYALSAKGDRLDRFNSEFFKKYSAVEGGIPHVTYANAERVKLPRASSYNASTGNWERDSHDNRREFILNDEYEEGSLKESWDIADVDLKNGKGVYIEIRRFFGQDKDGEFDIEPNSLQSRLAELSEELDEDIELYGFKPSSAKKVGKGWVSLWDYLREFGESGIAELAEEFVKGETNNRALCESTIEGMHHLISDELPAGPMKDYLVARKTMKRDATVYSRVLKLVHICRVSAPNSYVDTVKPDIDLNALKLRAGKQYPLLNSLDIGRHNKKEVVRYIEMVEKTA
jgi:hypothetical protein